MVFRFVNALRDYGNEIQESLRIFQPTDPQKAFVESKCRQRIIVGGNRCLSGDTEIYDPVQGKAFRIGDMPDSPHVLAHDGSGSLVVAKASKPFLKGVDDLYKVTLSNGRSFKATKKHLIWSSSGWISVGDVCERLRGSLPTLVPSTSDRFFEAEGFPRPTSDRFFEAEGFPRLDCFASVVSVSYHGRGEYFDLTVPVYANYYCESIVHHNSGKTITAAVTFAREVTGQGVPGMSPKRGGIYYVVGKEWREIGEVLYPMLFKPGAFKAIRDEKTRLLRPFRPWDGDDAMRTGDVEPAPPLIPDRFYSEKDVSWYNKRLGQPSMIYLRAVESTIHFYSSAPGSSPTQGSAVDGAWFDEEILDDIWYDEVSARLLSKNGWFIWSASPELSTPKYKRLYDWARKEERDQPDESKRSIVAIELNLLNNPHLNKDAVAGFAKKLEGSNRYATKIGGKFAWDLSLVYPEFDEQSSTIRPFQIPDDWTRRMIVDPGHQVCFVLFVATPPASHEYGGHVILYDQLHINKCSAEMFAMQVHQMVGDQNFYEFIIDQQGYRMTDIGSGETVGGQYAEQLGILGIESETTGSGFNFSIKDVRSGISYVKSWLRINEKGRPKMLIMDGRVPTVIKEMASYRFVRDPATGDISDRPVKTKFHAMDCLRYAAANGCEYIAPKPKEIQKMLSYHEWVMGGGLDKAKASKNSVINFGAVPVG